MNLPVKVGNLIKFLTGSVPTSPLSTFPVYSLNSSYALMSSSTQEFTFATMVLTGIDNYGSYESDGVFLGK